MKNASFSELVSVFIRAFARKSIPALLIAAVCWPVAADAAGYMYSGKRKVVNCGILLLDNKSTGGSWSQPVGLGAGASSRVGSLFNLLDSNPMKPAGWSLDNPYAPVDSKGIKYTKNDPRFWMIPLASARNLSKMHILYLPAQGNVLLSDDDREKLRRFVDSGGVLWVDNISSSNYLDFRPLGDTSSPGTFFISNFYFEKGAMGGADIAFSRHHPTVSLPYWIDDREIFSIGSLWGQNACHPGGWQVIGDPPYTTDILFSIVAQPNGALPSVAANAYGSGRVVATANYAGDGCFYNYPYCVPSLKLAYNIIAWSSSWTDLRKNPRRSAAGIDTVGGSSLVKIWSAENAKPTSGTETGATIYKNMTFFSSGNMVYAYDVMPSEDLDSDGNPDDGVPDIVNGMAPGGQDLVWAYECDSPVSAPTVVTCQDPRETSKTIETVLVMSTTGRVYMLDAFPRNGNVLKGITDVIVPVMKLWTKDDPTNPSDKDENTPNPSPPICVNGWIYVVAGDGRLYARNPALEIWQRSHPTPPVHSRWIVPGLDFSQPTKLKSGAMFGYVNASNNSAVIGMVYWCVSAPISPGIQQEQNDYIYGVPVYVKNDRLRWRSTTATSASEYFTDYQSSFPDLRISSTPAPVVRSAAGGAFSVRENSSLPLLDAGDPTPRNGFFVVKTATQLATNTIMYADYSLDYSTGSNDWMGAAAISPLPRVRAPLIPSSIRAADTGGALTGGNEVPPIYVASMPALGPDNVIYVSAKRDATPFGAGGAVYSIKNDGSTAQSTKWVYMLHSGCDNSMMQGVTTPVLPVPGLLTRKPVSVPDMAAATIKAPQAYGSPVVYGDKVFVTVNSGTDKGGALLCFKANSDFVIRIMQVSGVDQAGNPIKEPKRLDVKNAAGAVPVVKIWQPNLITGSTGLGPAVEAVVVPGNMLDRDKGTITFSNFNQLKLRGGIGVLQETNTFSPSLPVWVTVDEVELPIDWTSWGPTASLTSFIPSGPIPKPQTDCVDLSGWNNLLWYYVPPNCSGIHSSPVLIGNCIYFTTDDGRLYAVDAETGETTGAPMDIYDPIADAAGNWTQNSKFVIWNEDLKSTASANVSVSGSNGVLMVPTGNGLCAYANPTTLVADSNRLVEVDSSGNVSWSLDSVYLPASIPADGGGAAIARRSVPINKPSRARYTENGEIMLVNTGSDMVCKTDRNGNIAIQKVKSYTGGTGWIRMSYDKFADPKALLRPGQPCSLSSPTDAIMWSENEAGPNQQVAVIHCIVADSGNSRVLDLVYRFDNSGKLLNTTQDQETGYYMPELNWASNTETKGERYVYQCLQMVPNPRKDSNAPYTYQIWAAISNYRVDGNVPNPQGMGGAIVGLNYRNRAANATQWNYSASTFPAPVTAPGKIASGCAQITLDGKVVPFACPTYFQVIDTVVDGNPLRFALVCDNRGAYKIGPLGGAAPPVVEHLWDQEYRDLIRDRNEKFGSPLRASSVQELPNGKWLIANSWSGMDKSGTTNFSGEVFELEKGKGIVWSSPTLKLDNSVWKQTMGTSYKFQQPRSAFRNN